MAKEYSFVMSKQIIEKSSKPLRSREEAVLLILYTIRMLDICKYITEEREEKVIFSIDKMNRIFYQSENKVFSMQFPFCIEKNSDDSGIVIYDLITRKQINSTVLSLLIEAFERLSRVETDFETLFEIVMEPQENGIDISEKEMWKLVEHLLKYDLGYLRCDHDSENAEGDLHPLNHFDIFLDSQATFKIGLKKQIDYCRFQDILNINTDCTYLRI
jgi:hypothetical protein